ncbi:unnamed protein product [Closterium sp. NIES-54]
MDIERPTSDGLLRLHTIPTASTSNPGGTGPATMEEEEDSGKSATTKPDIGENITAPATGWGSPGPVVGPWGEVLTPEEADVAAGGGRGTSTKERWGQSAPAYPEAPGLPPAEVAAVDPYWATRGTSWGGPPLPDQYALDTPEPVQEESEEELTYELAQAPPSSSLLVTDEQVHAGKTDDIIGIPRALLERNSVRAFAADADTATDTRPEKQQNDEAARHKYYQKTVRDREEPEIWHQRLGHPSHATLKNSLKAGVFDDDALLLPHGGSLTAESANPPCTVCPTASLAHKPFPYLPPGYERYKPLDKVYSDFMILSQTGLNGIFYTLTFIDACTRYVWAVNTDYRSLSFEFFVAWMKRAERQSGLKLKTYQTDGGLEFLGGGVVFDIAYNRVVTTSDVVFYENMSLEVWKSEDGPASGRTPTIPPTDISIATLPLLAEVGEPAAEDVEDVPSPFPSPAPHVPPLVADLCGLTPLTGEQAAAKPTKKQSATRQLAEEPTTGEKSAGKAAEVQQDDEGSEASDDGGDAEESTDTDVVEVQCGPRQSCRIRRPPDFYVPAAFTTAYDEVDDDLQYDDAEEDEDFPELDPDMHAGPEHRWDILTMTVKEVLTSWKGKAVKAAMEEEIRSLVGMGTWELVERSLGVNIMKNRWVMTTKYHINDTVECEKARLVVKGFTQVYGADYDETYAPVSSYVTLRIFLIIVAVLDLNLMQLDMKNAFLQSKLDRVLYMYQPDYFNNGTGRVCKLLKSLYGLKRSPLLWYRALDGVLLGAGWKKSQVDTALYFKVGVDKVTCWVLVYVNDLLAARSSAAMLKELLKAAFELREISPRQKYLGLEIVRDKSVRKLWLHHQG